MISRRVLPFVLFGLAFGIVAGSGSADARHRCRSRVAGTGWTSSYNTGYAYNNGYNTGYGYRTGFTNYSGTNYNAQPNAGDPTSQSGVVTNQVNYPPNVPANNGAVIQAPIQQVQPAPALPANQAPVRQPSTVAPDPSPDADNSVQHRTTTAIPGANPAKAPAPAAAATTPQ